MHEQQQLDVDPHKPRKDAPGDEPAGEPDHQEACAGSQLAMGADRASDLSHSQSPPDLVLHHCRTTPPCGLP